MVKTTGTWAYTADDHNVFVPDVRIRDIRVGTILVPLRGHGYTLAVYSRDQQKIIGYMVIEDVGPFSTVKQWIERTGWKDTGWPPVLAGAGGLGALFGFRDVGDYGLRDRYSPGDRVELHPGTDYSMMGDRYGDVVSMVRGKAAARVRLDKSGRTVVVRVVDLKTVE